MARGLPDALRAASGQMTPLEPELVKTGAARGISDLTAPGLCYRSDYPRGGEAWKAWSSSQKRLSKYRFASFLFPQFSLPDTVSSNRLGLQTQHFSVLLFCFLLYPLH